MTGQHVFLEDMAVFTVWTSLKKIHTKLQERFFSDTLVFVWLLVTGVSMYTLLVLTWWWVHDLLRGERWHMTAGGGVSPALTERPIRPVKPPLNKKLFPVYRPGGSKRTDWNFFFFILSKKKKIFLLFSLYILVYKKNEFRKKIVCPTGPQETIFFYLRVASVRYGTIEGQ